MCVLISTKRREFSALEFALFYKRRPNRRYISIQRRHWLLQGLEEEVVLAAEILADIPNSKAALENSELFKAAWINQVMFNKKVLQIVVRSLP